MYTVYSLKAPDGRVYVGTTSMTLRERWNKGNGYRFLPELWSQIQQYGWDSIEKTIHAEGLSQQDASALEQKLIHDFDSCNPEHGFNRELGGVNAQKIISDSIRKKQSESHTGEKNFNYGKHFSEEHRRKLSESNTGQKRSAETRAKIGESMAKPVNQYSISGELIAEWRSGKDAASATGIQAGHISKVCKGQRKTAGGFVWRFA